jgi:hypothetical protein
LKPKMSKPKKAKRFCRDPKCPRMKLHYTSSHLKPEPVPLRMGAVLDKEDFTDYAVDEVGVWESLIQGLPKGTTRIEVNVVRRVE